MPKIDLGFLAREGITPRPGTKGIRTADVSSSRMGMDALPVNNSLPAHFLNYFDPRVIRTLLMDPDSERLFPAVKMGGFPTKTATFIQHEFAGDVDVYGDFSHNATVDNNYSFETVDTFTFETSLRVGDMQQAEWSEANINWLSDAENATAEVIRRAHDRIAWFGIDGLRTYGITNQPDAAPSITPKVGSDGTSILWDDKTALDIYNDVIFMRSTLRSRLGNRYEASAPQILVVPTAVADSLDKTNEYGLTVYDRLKKIAPNMEIISTPHLELASGDIAMLIVPELAGQATGNIGFTERFKSHGMVRMKKSWEEVKSGGSAGARVFRPACVVSMVGV